MIDQEKYEKAKAMLEQQGLDVSLEPTNAEAGAGGVSLPAAERQPEVMERVEGCPAGLALVQEVSAVLQRRKGAALIIDYGAQLYTIMPTGHHATVKATSTSPTKCFLLHIYISRCRPDL